VTTSLPLLLLDVDGVLNPFAAPACPPGYTEHEFFPGEDPVRPVIRFPPVPFHPRDKLPASSGSPGADR
jgi:hypothetical protein